MAFDDKTADAANIAKDLKEALKGLKGASEGINGSLASALGLEKDIAGTVEDILNKKKTGLVVDNDTGRAAVERIKMTSKLAKYTDDQLQSVFKMRAGMGKLVKNARAFISVLLTNPMLAIAAAILAAGKFLFTLVKDAQELRRDFGLTAIEATKITGALRAAKFASKAFMLESEDVKDTFTALASTFGEINVKTVGFSLELSRAARNIGLGNKEAVDLLATVSAATGQSKDLALNTIETIASLARAEGVAPSVVFSDLASDANAFASFIGRGEENLIKAAAAARKVGLEFSSIVQFGDDLLNITDRLEKEQTLSIITGKQIRLDRVAILTSQGRIAEAQRELATQLRAVQGLSAQQIRFAAGTVGMDVNALMKLVQLGESSLREQKQLNRNQMN
jgi:hypothetical protein